MTRGGDERTITLSAGVRSARPANMFPTDGRERKQGGTSKGIVVDLSSCSPAMLDSETCSPIAAT